MPIRDQCFYDIGRHCTVPPLNSGAGSAANALGQAGLPPAAATTHTLSIIIPVYNEQATIAVDGIDAIYALVRCRLVR